VLRGHAATRACLLLIAALNSGALEQLPVLLLRHALTALLDHRTHGATSSMSGGMAGLLW
jgi:hypothetical protein